MSATTIRPRKLFTARISLTVAAALLLTTGARAQTFTWTSFATGNWSTASNWDLGAPPSQNTTNLVFNSSLDIGYTATNDLGNPFALQTLSFNNQSGAAITIAGTQIQMTGANPLLAMSGPGAVSISAPIDLPGAMSMTGSSFSGAMTLNGQITGANGSILINRFTTNYAGVNALNSGTANTFGGGITIQNGILSLSSGANAGTGPITITATGTKYNATGELRVSGTAIQTLNVPVNINSGATLTTNINNAGGAAGGAVVFGQAINGAGGISIGNIFSSGGTYTLEQASGFTGRLDDFRAVFALRGTTGALTGATNLEFYRNSSLTLDSNAATTGTGNTAGNQISQNRIPDNATVTLHRTNFNFTANAGATTTETFGTFNGDGWNIMNMTPQAAAGLVMTVNNLSRNGNRGTFEWGAANLGATAAGTAGSVNVLLGSLNGGSPLASLVGGGGDPGTTNISIIPFMTSAAASGAVGSSLVTYDAANGIRALNTAAEFATSLQIVPYGPGATDNVRLATLPLVVASQPVTANSLVLATAANNGVYGIGLTGRLNITSGVIHNTISTSFLGVGEVNFGGAEGVFTGNGQMVVTSALTNNSGITYSGGFRMSLMSPNNVIGGPISLNFGTIQINNQAQLGGATSINLNGGFLQVSNLATGSQDTISTPINVGLAGGIIQSIPVGANASGASQIINLTGPITGSGPLQFNGGGTGAIASGGTVILAGNASGFSGEIVVTEGVLQFDSDARLGTGTAMNLGSTTAGTPATLFATANTATSKNLYLGATGFIRADAGVTYSMNGFITGGAQNVTTSELRKIGAGTLVITREATYNGATTLGNTGPTFLNVGGTLTLRDQGAILNTSSFTINADSTLVADNTGSANLSNRLNNVTVNLAGGGLRLLGSANAASSEIVGQMSLTANTGSIVEVVPGAGQTAALYFSGPTSGGLVRNAGSTLTLRAPGLGGVGAGSGQINFINNTPPPPGTGPALTGNILANVFGEDSANNAIGLVTYDTAAASGGFPINYRTRLLNTASDYTNNAFPNSGVSTANFRQTAAAAPTGSPTVNSLFLDAGGSVAIGVGNQVAITSGTLLMAGGTTISGSTGALNVPSATDLSIYVGSGNNATIGSNIVLVTPARTIAKTGPGNLELTTAITGATGTYSIQRGSLRLGTGGSIPIASTVGVDAGATFDINGTGAAVEVGALNGLGSVLLGSASGTVLRVSGAGTSVFGGSITGTGSVEKSGTGTLAFAHTASYAGPITLTAGILRFGDASGLTPLIPVVAGGTITAANGTTIQEVNVVDFQRPIDAGTGNTVTFNLAGGFGTTSRMSGAINVGAGSTINFGGSTSGFSRVSSPISGQGNVGYTSVNFGIVDGNNTYTGTTSITGGTLTGIGSDTAFGNGGTVTVGTTAAAFVAVGGNRTISNPLNLNVDITHGTTSSIYQGFDLTFSGPAAIPAATTRTITTTAAGKLTLTDVSGVGSNITKAGGGTLVLAGANISYSGTTAINAGTLQVNGVMAAGGNVSVGAGAVLGGSGTINRNVALNSLGSLKPGSSPGKLTVGGNVTMAANSVYFWELSANTTSGPGTNWSQLQMTSGDLNIAAQPSLVPAFVGTSTVPSNAVPFWQTAQQWNHIVDLTGTATNSAGATNFVINNIVWSSAGNFTTIPGTTPGSVALLWTPVPEPLHILLVAGAGAAGFRWVRKRRKTQAV